MHTCADLHKYFAVGAPANLCPPSPRREAPQAQRQGQRARERAQEAAVGGGQGPTGLGAAEAAGAGQGSLAQREVSVGPARQPAYCTLHLSHVISLSGQIH